MSSSMGIISYSLCEEPKDINLGTHKSRNIYFGSYISPQNFIETLTICIIAFIIFFYLPIVSLPFLELISSFHLHFFKLLLVWGALQILLPSIYCQFGSNKHL